MLTLYLASPIVVFAGLYALIFVTQDKDKLMRDAPPIGAGAGDTGNANAIGEWLSGRDPDAISLATKAKRERLMIAPSDWPGGVLLSVPQSALPAGAERVYLTVIHRDSGTYSTTNMRHDNTAGRFEAELEQSVLQNGSRFVIATSLPSSNNGQLFDEQGRALAVLTMSPVLAPSDVDVNDQLPVFLPIDSVYESDSP